MNNENVDIVRPFARMMANEMPMEEVEKKGPFVSMRSGSAFNDWPDIP